MRKVNICLTLFDNKVYNEFTNHFTYNYNVIIVNYIAILIIAHWVNAVQPKGNRMIIKMKELDKIHRNADKRIILATGTFDMFHYEHLIYLKQAKNLGGTLVVAVKSDKCARLKDPIKPIIEQDQRIAIVDAIQYVDFTVMVDYDEKLEPKLVYDNEAQKQWLVMFEDVFSSLKPGILFHENNPKLQTARDRVFEKYGIQGIAKERGESISTSKIIRKMAMLLQ